MRGELARKKFQGFQIDNRQDGSARKIDLNRTSLPAPNMAAVNLKHFQKSCECFSKWHAIELKSFSNWVEKMASRTQAQVTSVTQTCHAHKGRSRPLPATVSPEVNMYSLDVGPKTRVHGFFFDGTFFLVWLDRDGAILGH